MSVRLEPISVSRILVAVDGSEHSRKAVDLALECAGKWNAEIYLIHVREERNIPEGFEEWAKAEHEPPSSYFERIDEQILGPAEDRARSAGIGKVERISVQGDPAEEILRAAETRKVDLIILGSRGLGTFSRSFLGSVSMKVLSHANCTCITVK